MAGELQATVELGGARTKPLALEHASPSTRLLEKWRQMFEVQEALEAQKQEFARKEEVFRRREEVLKKKDLELQESLIRFSKFLQENDSKKARAEKKASDEVKSRQLKEREIEQLSEALEQKREEKEHIDEVLEGYMPYQRYLESVLEVADEYQEVQDLLLRHATLQATNDDLRAHQQRCSQEAEDIRTALQAFIKQKSDEILDLNNTLAKLKKQLEQQEEQAGLLESSKDRSMQVAAERTLVCGQVVLSTDNIFSRCRQKSHIAHPPVTQPLQQLDIIANFVSDLLAVCKQGAAAQPAATAGS